MCVCECVRKIHRKKNELRSIFILCHISCIKKLPSLNRLVFIYKKTSESDSANRAPSLSRSPGETLSGNAPIRQLPGSTSKLLRRADPESHSIALRHRPAHRWLCHRRVADEGKRENASTGRRQTLVCTDEGGVNRGGDSLSYRTALLLLVV